VQVIALAKTAKVITWSLMIGWRIVFGDKVRACDIDRRPMEEACNPEAQARRRRSMSSVPSPPNSAALEGSGTAVKRRAAIPEEKSEPCEEVMSNLTAFAEMPPKLKA
jgi:hypothetical protein